MNSKPITICYFGIYRPTAPRDKVYLEGLKKLGVKVEECTDNSLGLLKFFRLTKKHRTLQGQYDILWVGYLSTMVVPLAWLLFRKKIIFNALDSWYDRTVLDRGAHSRFSPKAWAIWFFDFLAFHLAHIVLVESKQQKLFITKKFFLSPKKLSVVFTGVDEAVFYPDPTIAKTPDFTVVFRGMFLPATGVEYVIEAARLLKDEDEDVQFRIIGWGEPLQTKIQKMIAEQKLFNVNLTTVFLSPDELRNTILSANVMLGQFGSHLRLERTIQHKTSEALALGMPYITRDSLSSRELLIDGENCVFVPEAEPQAIADAILKLKKDKEFRQKIAFGARKTYCEKLTPEILAGQVFDFLGR